jgi:hypothetical protein
MQCIHIARAGVTALALASFSIPLLGCADSTIHELTNVGDVKTLSLDAKQRLVMVANRSAGDGERVTCAEAMPDAIVARAAVAAARGNFSDPTGLTAGGGVSGGSTESAASIGFRNETIQMLRDGYYRLCEAYMNGALTSEQYQDMILNADTFMVTISALQNLGPNPVAPAVAIQAGGVTASVKKDDAEASVTTGKDAAPIIVPIFKDTPKPPAKSAEMSARIVRDYLGYRLRLTQALRSKRGYIDRKRHEAKNY